MMKRRNKRSTRREATGTGRSSYTLLLAFLILSALMPALSDAKVYIDITSPGIRKLPLSIKVSGPSAAKTIEWVVKSDLDATGLFSFSDPGMPGVEMKADVEVTSYENRIKAIVSVNDLIEGKEVLKKSYSASESSARTVAHGISNDIYEVATGRKGVFRTKLSFLAVTAPGEKELRLMDWDGYNSFRVPSRGLTASHAWTKDGQRLLYSSEQEGMWRIYSLDLTQYGKTVIFSSNGLNLVGDVSGEDLVAFSSSRDGNSEIYTINTSGGDLKKITRSLGIDVSPAFSPDSGRIAFVSDRGGTPQIYTVNSDGSGLRRITFEGSYNTSPAWSPDGKWIAYVGRIDGKNQIFMVKSDNSESRQLTYSGNNENPVFSPDGFFIAFDSDIDGKRGIYIMRANGEGRRRITPGHLDATKPKWSPY